MGFDVLGIASQALAAQQLALEVTGNNMANATTPGYAVESVDLTENAPAPSADMPSTIIGDGVTATAVTQATNAFLSTSVNNQTSAVAYATALQQGISQVQNIFEEPQSGGLAEMMNQFSQSWLALSESPTSLSAAESVVQDGQTLASTLNNMSSSLSSEESSVNQNITSQVQQINQYSAQIAQLNQQIATVSTSGQQPLALIDQRNQLLTQLSKLTNISYTSGPADSVDVYIGAHPLVTGKQTYQININTVGVPNSAGTDTFTADQPVWADSGAPVQVHSGSLAGNLALLYQQTISGSTGGPISAGYLTGYGQSLDTLAAQIANTVNNLQESGYAQSGSTATGIPFFTDGQSGTTTNITAGTITVNPNLTPDLVAQSSSANSPGNGSNAETMYNNLTNEVMTIGSSTTTLSGYYQSLVGQVGLDGQNANNLATDSQNTLTSLNNDLQSATGVDLNQQSINMIQEEQSYEAAAKLVTTQQSVVQSLLSAVS
ncbi:MAG: flagellar hook-associated protein FlgK [Sulfobacillus acidophilus]|uniref:Flagellar hook-associated protein 1 n=1 Tax=Sulfobacillus acidophilus TaxID=53633 RepID=A0A2T2WMC2_9FIRM|nr:MAG: flagellar hook-associated protein FlgK [Sulfobacillus acidophilus]